jgi:hypothetical protein
MTRPAVSSPDPAGIGFRTPPPIHAVSNLRPRTQDVLIEKEAMMKPLVCPGSERC